MNKAELVAAMAEKTGMKKNDAEKASYYRDANPAYTVLPLHGAASADGRTSGQGPVPPASHPYPDKPIPVTEKLP